MVLQSLLRRGQCLPPIRLLSTTDSSLRGPDNSSRTIGQLYHEQGRFAVLLPYPTIVTNLETSPPSLPQVPLHQQRWEVTIRVRYQPASLVPLTGTDLPELRDILNQTYSGIIEDLGGSPAANMPVDELTKELTFGRDLVLRTDGISESILFLEPVISSP